MVSSRCMFSSPLRTHKYPHWIVEYFKPVSNVTESNGLLPTMGLSLGTLLLHTRNALNALSVTFDVTIKYPNHSRVKNHDAWLFFWCNAWPNVAVSIQITFAQNECPLMPMWAAVDPPWHWCLCVPNMQCHLHQHHMRVWPSNLIEVKCWKHSILSFCNSEQPCYTSRW